MEGYNNGHPAAPGMMGYQDYQSPEEGKTYAFINVFHRHVRRRSIW